MKYLQYVIHVRKARMVASPPLSRCDAVAGRWPDCVAADDGRDVSAFHDCHGDLTLGLLKQLRAEPLAPIASHETQVVPAPPTHNLDAASARVPAAGPITG
ncbi:hypothetical protein MES5069_390033 [Mesorhizobium escarrei]|uniref:Uncharacterized protein n=1 Tax=Mesorhizobium escarrei TaxID=666018 RepID=A0ABM9E390_9HYPH|nr:hypothetical protein MES5069_390033 [Mesorhizobium escarrei]